MTKNGEKYSAYVASYSNSLNIWALFSGFTFTVITVLLTQFPDLMQTTAQITLFLLAVMLDLFLYHLLHDWLVLLNCIRIAPPIPNMWIRMENARLILYFVCWIFLHMSVVLLYFLWNLMNLTLASGSVAVLFICFTNLTVVRPFFKFQQPIARQ